ncbi:ABC transporter permease [Terrabacter sp. GCM10028922]|uniref:ABC transporter permease n=1 Tax=Terrabacter sp. GCM10028922 TaxID=3273428 RepID=UPI00360DF8D5
MGSAVDLLIDVLQAPDPVLLATVFALVGLAVRGWRFALIGLSGLLLVISMGQWAAAMQTLALVLVSTVVAVVIAIPLGVLAARSPRTSAVLRPIMDLMQTMPAFVWLVPVVTLFSIGVVPGVVATIIFALPPGVRLTELGIRSVDAEMVEAANAFGATPRQTLFGVQLPLALPTIMAGINQVIMLALSMAVISGLVGAEGLGGQVTAAIATLDLGLGFEAGLSVVILAIYLDRVTASIGQGNVGGALLSLSRRRRSTVQKDIDLEETAEEEPAAQGDPRTPISA